MSFSDQNSSLLSIHIFIFFSITTGSNLIKQVLSNAKQFIEKKNMKEFYDLCGPLTIRTARVLAKMGFYDSSLNVLQERFEKSLLIPELGLRQTSLNFLDLFLSALAEIKQRASRVILSRMYDVRIGSNVTQTILENKGTCLKHACRRQWTNG